MWSVTAVWRAFHPAYVCRRYTVTLSEFSVGSFRCFWLLKNALRYYEAAVMGKSAWIITLVDDFSGRELKRWNRGDKYGMRIDQGSGSRTVTRIR